MIVSVRRKLEIVAWRISKVPGLIVDDQIGVALSVTVSISVSPCHYQVAVELLGRTAPRQRYQFAFAGGHDRSMDADPIT